MGLRRHRCHLSRHLRRKGRRTLQSVKLIAIAVAVAFNDVFTPAIVDRAETIAHPHSSSSRTWVFVVTDAIWSTSASQAAAHSQSVKLIAMVAVAFNDVFTAAIVDRAETVAHPTFVEFSDTWVFVVTDAI